MEPHISSEHPDQFLKRFKWNGSIIQADEKRQFEDFLVEFLNMSAENRCNVGYISETSMKLFPKHEQPVYT